MGVFRTTMDALKRGLGRTRETMGSPLIRLLQGRRIDADTIDAIERCLLQADVGAGKTAVAVYAMLVAVAAGSQAVLMAPPELLAPGGMEPVGACCPGGAPPVDTGFQRDTRARRASRVARQPA